MTTTMSLTKETLGLNGSRFMTGIVLLTGFSLLGLGCGLLLSDPGSGLIAGAGFGLVAVGLIRALRGL
jgi:hypothetical protein